MERHPYSQLRDFSWGVVWHHCGVRNLVTGPSSDAFPQIDFRSLYHTMPSFYYLLPHASIWKDTVIVTTPNKSYTANNYKDLFTDAGYPQGYTHWSEIGMEWPAPS